MIPVSRTSLTSLRSSGPNNSKPGIYNGFNGRIAPFSICKVRKYQRYRIAFHIVPADGGDKIKMWRPFLFRRILMHREPGNGIIGNKFKGMNGVEIDLCRVGSIDCESPERVRVRTFRQPGRRTLSLDVIFHMELRDMRLCRVDP